MFVRKMVNDWLSDWLPRMHSARRAILSAVVATSCLYRVVGIAALGRRLANGGSVKHAIKTVDRLMDNRHLHSERTPLYAWLAHFLPGTQTRPLLLLDWSQVHPGSEQYVLRVAALKKGRALAIYEEVYRRGRMDKAKTMKTVLANLAQILPAGSVPILVMDAGFRNPWFKAIEKYGWHWVARIRGQVCYQKRLDKDWQACQTLHETATAIARRIGDVRLAKTHPHGCTLHLYKSKSTDSKRHRHRAASRDANVLKARRRAKEPWVLASSRSLSDLSSQEIVAIYKQRMKIEESFRDTKSHLGWRFEEMRSYLRHKIENLLIVAAVALFALTVIGRYAESQQMQKDYQANTETKRRVLSVLKLGWNVVRNRFTFRLALMRQALQDMTKVEYA